MPRNQPTSYGDYGRTTGTYQSISLLLYTKGLFARRTFLYLTCRICVSDRLTTSPSLDDHPTPRDVDMRWCYFAQDVNKRATRATVSGEFHESYLPWYYQVSILRLTGPSVEDAHPITDQDILAPAAAPLTINQRLDITTAQIQETIGSTCYEPNSPAYRLFWSFCRHIAGRGFGLCFYSGYGILNCSYNFIVIFHILWEN